MNKKEIPRLVETEQGLTLTDGRLSLTADFTSMLPRLKQSNLEHEVLIKAVRIKGYTGPLQVLDATAGLGEDSLLLAAAGFNVDLYEYDPIISALLQDALARGANHEQLAPVVARMRLHRGDSIAAMKALAGDSAAAKPDVILLDPMFPAREKSGLIKKKFQLLQQLESPCCNEADLLAAALELSPQKVVIKRPAKGPYLAGCKPSYSLTGKAIRYDIIFPG